MSKRVQIDLNEVCHGKILIDGEEQSGVVALLYEARVGELAQLHLELTGIETKIDAEVEDVSTAAEPLSMPEEHWALRDLMAKRQAWRHRLLMRNHLGYDPYNSEIRSGN